MASKSQGATPTFPSVDVVVPTYERRDLIAECLTRLREQTVPHRAIVVDDGSRDSTAEFVRERHPEAHVLALPGNVGFARAVNAGIRAGSGEAIVLLNNDVFCGPEFLEHAVAPLHSDPNVGMVAPLLLRVDEQSIDCLGIEVDRVLAGFPRYWGLPRDTAIDGRHMLGPTAGAGVYRRAALDQVGLLDEAILAYNEDLDLALRIRSAGWAAAIATEAKAVHVGSATFGFNSPRQVYLRGWSRFYVLRKYGVLRHPRAVLSVALGEGTSVLFQLVATRDAAGLRGRLAGWKAARRADAVAPASALNPDIGAREAMRRRRTYRS